MLTASEREFLRILSEQRHLPARECSVAAFVLWLQQLGETGEWDQFDLVQHYETLCDRTGATAMPAKWFGQALEKLGCERWRAEMNRDGRRWRPYKIRIPGADGEK